MTPFAAGATGPGAKAPGVSIITVCRNAAATMEACLQSVGKQSYRAFEHIVIDGGSTDGTLEILRRHANAIATLVSEPDRGIYDAMNKGIARARGTFVIFLNADDFFAGPHALRDAMAEIDAQPDDDVYYGGLVVRDAGVSHRYMPPPPELAVEEMVLGCLPHQATFARRAVFDRTGLFDLRWRRHADYDWWLKVLADPAIRIRRIGTYVASFALGGASSELAKGQPEVFAIQNASPIYRSAQWDKRRIEILQAAWLTARIEAARLREATRSGSALAGMNWKGRLAARLPPSVVRSLQTAKRRIFGASGAG
ncbi:glycosyltransferase family 2 protein [Roseomonas sp. HF4]|uniref:glycosyltransferase family 2 protein n=1 Tax=Roseomonas sp. HF4 TaxID=2562313 RepID=UPI0014854848|nr:glycosyltransferase family 2 protein [Roseomonas sp. HF4]